MTPDRPGLLALLRTQGPLSGAEVAAWARSQLRALLEAGLVERGGETEGACCRRAVWWGAT